MKRSHQILTAALVIQLLISVLVFWPRQADSRPGAILLPDLEAEEVISLTLQDNDGQRLTLRKVAGAWVLPEADDYPARESVIMPILEKIATLSSATVVARTAASHIQLQVAEDAFVRRLDLEMEDGARHTVYIGSAPRATAAHIRVAGQPETYLTTQLSSWELNVQASHWIDTLYIEIDQADVTEVTLENAQGSFTLVRDEEQDTWTLIDLAADETIAVAQTSAVVRNATRLSMLRPLGTVEEPVYGMDNPQATVMLQTEDGVVHMLTVGDQDPVDNTYVVKYSDSAYYVRVAGFNVSAMVENSREDFLSPPVTESEELELPTP